MPGESVAAAYLGMAVVAGVVFLFLGLVFGTDAYFAKRGYGSLGRWVMEWSRLYPAWVFFFSFFVGALLGHLFTKPPFIDFHLG
jgi:hypothetical protein